MSTDKSGKQTSLNNLIGDIFGGTAAMLVALPYPVVAGYLMPALLGLSKGIKFMEGHERYGIKNTSGELSVFCHERISLIVFGN